MTELRMDTSAIRAQMKKQRALLTDEQVVAASLDITYRLWHQPFMLRSRRIAAYFAFGGEVECRFLIEGAWRRGREVYLPVIRGKGLAFAQFCANSGVIPNRYGIPEPVCPPPNLFKPSDMDVILAPLVAFDEFGNRIGMGAGFYDRTLRFLKHRHRWLRPRVVGLAYEFQKTAQIKASGWDIPLHKVITEHRVYSAQ
jgi:5-formyltetrahydrofolate cyclo-ligase